MIHQKRTAKEGKELQKRKAWSLETAEEEEGHALDEVFPSAPILLELGNAEEENEESFVFVFEERRSDDYYLNGGLIYKGRGFRLEWWQGLLQENIIKRIPWWILVFNKREKKLLIIWLGRQECRLALCGATRLFRPSRKGINGGNNP